MCRHDARLDVQLLWIHRAANRSRTFARGPESTVRDPEAQGIDAEGGCFKPVDHGAVIPFDLLDDAHIDRGAADRLYYMQAADLVRFSNPRPRLLAPHQRLIEHHAFVSGNRTCTCRKLQPKQKCWDHRVCDVNAERSRRQRGRRQAVGPSQMKYIKGPGDSCTSRVLISSA